MQERVSQFLAGLTRRKDEVRRRCRTVLQSRTEALSGQPPGLIHNSRQMHIPPWLWFSITAAHEWEGFGGVAGDGNARPGPDVSVSIATTVPSSQHSGVVATAAGIAGVAPWARSWG